MLREEYALRDAETRTRAAEERVSADGDLGDAAEEVMRSKAERFGKPLKCRDKVILDLLVQARFVEAGTCRAIEKPPRTREADLDDKRRSGCLRGMAVAHEGGNFRRARGAVSGEAMRARLAVRLFMAGRDDGERRAKGEAIVIRGWRGGASCRQPTGFGAPRGLPYVFSLHVRPFKFLIERDEHELENQQRSA